eukprot:m.703014 g.703014  ORF g.703014 m.703014 type:complete len:72 (-) comp58714_c0_seq7:1054-1269(-)
MAAESSHHQATNATSLSPCGSCTHLLELLAEIREANSVPRNQGSLCLLVGADFEGDAQEIADVAQKLDGER